MATLNLNRRSMMTWPFIIWNIPQRNPHRKKKTGVSFKGDTEEFESAHKALENMMNKARTTYNVEGKNVLVKSVPKASRITIEITNKNGQKGCVGLQFHNPKKGKNLSH